MRSEQKPPPKLQSYQKTKLLTKAVFYILELFYDLVYGRFPRKTLSDPENPLLSLGDLVY